MTGDYKLFKHGDYTFVCNYWETSRAWGHEVHLMHGLSEVSKARVRYYNRTWEKYTFQSAMYEALENYKKIEQERYLNNYKYSNGLKYWDTETHEEVDKPFGRGVKKKLLEEFETTETAKNIKALEDFVEGD